MLETLTMLCKRKLFNLEFRVQKKFQSSSSCQIFIINFPGLGKSKLTIVLELCIVYVSKNFYCRRDAPFTADVALTKILMKLDC